MRMPYKYLLFLGAFVKLLSFSTPVSASDGQNTFNPYAFSNRELLTRIGIGDGSTTIMQKLDTLQQALSSSIAQGGGNSVNNAVAELNTYMSQLGTSQQRFSSTFSSGMESSMNDTMTELSANVGAMRNSMEADLTTLMAQMTAASQGIVTTGAQIKTLLLEKIIDDCFSNSLIANQTPNVVFIGDSTFALADGEGKYVLKGGAVPYSLFSSNGATQQVAASLLLPADKGLTILRVLFGLSQTWITANISAADDLSAIVPTVFDYVLGTGRDGTGRFKDGSTVTNVFSKHSASAGTTTIVGKGVLATGAPVTTFLTSLGVTAATDDVKRFRMLCRYLLAPKP
ncbi:hypothetical protein [Candidatus Finniella inopinata]|uniref:Uncharacterized protein n=1 Tax=Candidatus Finniella inopinata TaxID=1696036 RepID=A0A4Q7DHG9_9PROT|nr:hypothetical protein [Candidatus Finniella inopinata]RZI45728.1 hypothetical protein EQU50_06405 [Candidatus Finniella inopinata]